MAGLRVYYDLMSQPSRAVVLFLKMNNIPFIDNVLALRRGEHLTEEYGKINPFHLVPAIDDDGFVLTESEAILKYLCGRTEALDHWYPSDLRARALVDQFCAWQLSNLHPNTTAIYAHQVIEPREKNIPVDQERVRYYMAELDSAMEALESVFLADRDYLAGDDISIADIMAICEVMQPHASGYDIYQGRPNFTAWMDRVRKRLQPHFDVVHTPLRRVFAKFGTAPKM